MNADPFSDSPRLDRGVHAPLRLGSTVKPRGGVRQLTAPFAGEARPEQKMLNGATFAATPGKTGAEGNAKGWPRAFYDTRPGDEITARPSPILMMPGGAGFLLCALSSAHPGGGPLRNPMADAPKTLVSINA